MTLDKRTLEPDMGTRLQQPFDEKAYWLALNQRHKAFDAESIAKALKEFGSIDRMWQAKPWDFEQMGFSRYAISEFMKLRDARDMPRVMAELERIISSDVRIITYVDDRYPRLLRDLGTQREGPPLLLFHRGSLLNFENCVAIVGTRELSLHGHVMARNISKAVAAEGFTVVSGLARGTDTEAHCGALEAKGGKTIAVLPWMEPLYPPEHWQLAKDIEARGALLSEHYEKKDGKPAPGDFVLRNRITSGISRCVIAVESGEEGGTVHQIRFAISQGRRVFAVKPKSGNSHAMKGYQLFVDLGATSVTSAKQVLRYLGEGESARMDAFIETQAKLK